MISSDTLPAMPAWRVGVGVPRAGPAPVCRRCSAPSTHPPVRLLLRSRNACGRKL